MPDQWIDKHDRLPKKEDADAQGCVLVWDALNGVKVAGYQNTQQLGRQYVTHWRTPPEGPRPSKGVGTDALGKNDQTGTGRAGTAN